MMIKTDKRIIIVAGHYGSGKTNIAVNLALLLKKTEKEVCVCDFDIVNPYFRSADNRAELEQAGVRTVIPELANKNVESVSFPHGYQTIFATGEMCVLDVGGDAEGIRIIALDTDRYIKAGYEMIFVANFRRPLTADAASALEYMRSMESASGLRFTQIINNTNLGAQTDRETVLESIPEAERLSKMAGIPLAATTAIIPVDGTIKIENKTKKLFG